MYHAQVTVILHHMFSPAELMDNPGAAAELEEDVKTEAAKLGERLLCVAARAAVCGYLVR